MGETEMPTEIVEKAFHSADAQRQLRQQGIDAVVIEALRKYGRMTHDHCGAAVVYFDRRARQRLAKILPHKEFARIESRLNVYAVVAKGGLVVTFGHRGRRIRRH